MSEALLQELMDINKAMKEELSKQNIILSSQKRYNQDEFDEAYQRGLNDAWEAARKINSFEGDIQKVFNYRGKYTSPFHYTASEAIAKLAKLEKYEDDKFNVEKEMIYEFCDKTGYDLDDLYKLIKKMRKE